jgi:hypothetical protein
MINRIPQIGDRVRLVVSHGDYPLEPVPAGTTGMVTAIEVGCNPPYFGVTLDARSPQLDEWGNELHFYGDPDGSDEELAAKCDEALEVIGTVGLNDLIDEFAAWCKREGKPHHSADELYHEAIDNPSYTDAQRGYLRAFSNRWDALAGGDAQ